MYSLGFTSSNFVAAQCVKGIKTDSQTGQKNRFQKSKYSK